MKPTLWTFLLTLTINSWWMWVVCVPSNLQSEDPRWGIIVIPVLLTATTLAFGFAYIKDNWDNNK